MDVFRPKKKYIYKKAMKVSKMRKKKSRLKDNQIVCIA